MKWQHLHMLRYIVRAAVIRTKDISFGVSIQPPASLEWSQSLPTGGYIVHPPACTQARPGKEVAFIFNICWIRSPSPNLSPSCCRESKYLPVTSCPFNVRKCAQVLFLAPTSSQAPETPLSFHCGEGLGSVLGRAGIGWWG